VLGHGGIVCRLVLWSKAAKALSTSPPKGVAFAGYWKRERYSAGVTPSSRL
jgi:hypothetical protein